MWLRRGQPHHWIVLRRVLLPIGVVKIALHIFKHAQMEIHDLLGVLRSTQIFAVFFIAVLTGGASLELLPAFGNDFDEELKSGRGEDLESLELQIVDAVFSK